TPEKDGTAQLHCKNLQGLANLIQVLSISIETSQTILQGVISKGLTDPSNPIIQMESAALERNNSRLQCAVSYVSITVEGFESRGVIQCFQCNQFNHTAEHCNLTPKCLKCGDKHQTGTARSRNWTPLSASTARFPATWPITANAPSSLNHAKAPTSNQTQS
ncbi:hypothetical protein TNCV_4973251, partial [Trichonephila clavipes]